MSLSARSLLMHDISAPSEVRWYKKVLHFKTPARTSRGALQERVTNILEVRNGEFHGYGECCTMPGLLPMPTDKQMDEVCLSLQKNGFKGWNTPTPSPIRFAVECAFLSVLRGGAPRWDTPFTRSEQGLRIHHLVWMSGVDAMLQSMAIGVKKGFRCLKMKVGAFPFEQELAMLREARSAFPHVEIRVDANGAFAPHEALQKLHALAEVGISSIEQPIAVNQWEQMAELCRISPLPIALDEELIANCHTESERELLLHSIKPAAVVIKPSLHGGIIAAEHWARLAEEMNIDWWVNSALESSIGLTALAEWCSFSAPQKLHGLGTGQLFADDTPAHIVLRGENLFYIP